MTVISTLRASHDRLAALAEPLGPDQLTARAYPAEWSIAQVFSHLGSGAEIFGRYLDAGLAGDPPPGQDVFRPIWDTWNAKAPIDQARDAIVSDRQLVERLEAFDAQEHEELRITMFTGPETVDGLAQLRLNEHTLHSWDVAVALDPKATLAPDATALVIDHLYRIAGWTGKPLDRPLAVSVVTTEPDRTFTLTLTDKAGLWAGASDAADASIELPAEAFIRLVYGRLDSDHTPPLSATGIDVDELRRVFPGL